VWAVGRVCPCVHTGLFNLLISKTGAFSQEWIYKDSADSSDIFREV